MNKVNTNWLLYDPINQKKKQQTGKESPILDEEIKNKIKLIEKAFR
jgi:hypothetical protein